MLYFLLSVGLLAILIFVGFLYREKQKEKFIRWHNEDMEILKKFIKEL